MATIRAIYNNLNKWAFYICLFTSIFLVVTAFFIPPQAVVDGSVIGCVGELFAFAALATVIAAIDKGIDAKIKKGDTEVHLENPDPEDNNRHKHHRHNDDFQID